MPLVRMNADMVMYGRLSQSLRFEFCLLYVVWRSRKCFPSRLALAVGLGYWVDPWQLVPDRIPLFGYSDQLIFVLCGLVVARLLIPSRLEYRAARKMRVGSAAHGAGHPACGAARAASVRSELVTQWLIAKRRLGYVVHRVSASLGKLRSRWLAAISRRRPMEILFALLGYRLWWALRNLLVARCSSIQPIVVIGGAARSGTTLLRTLLGRHPMLAGVPETTVFLRRISSPRDIADRLGWDPALIEGWQHESRSQAEFIERFQHAILEQSGKTIWVEKTPKNVERFGFVRRHFPKAKLVHIVRDGRDAVCSLRKTSFAKLDHAPWESVQATRRCAVQWRKSVRAGLRFRGDPAYYELRYEDLVGDPERTLRSLIEFLEVPWDDCILAPTSEEMPDRAVPSVGEDRDAEIAAGEIFGTSVGRWRQQLTHADCNALRLLISTTLVELGYVDGLYWSTCSPHYFRTSAATEQAWHLGRT